jgi:succinoglycan biosynthesis protein ExoM
MPKTCILICTFERQQLLQRLLAALVEQVRPEDCTLVVVDNGPNSSEIIVSNFKTSMNIIYAHVLEPGLVSARNKALALGLALHPEYLAFIDDDEVPEAGWLANLIQRIEQTGADIACGPVVPEYSELPPRWISQGEFFNAFGDSLRTSNLMMRASCVPADDSLWFSHEFNFSGGEDNEFLSRLVANGAIHVTAEAAIVRETVPRSRMNRRYIWCRGLRDGVAIAQIAALRSRRRAGFVATILSKAGAKLGYGVNHLFWAPSAPWRLQRGIADFASAWGIILRALGVKFAFYGQAEVPQDLSGAGR